MLPIDALGQMLLSWYRANVQIVISLLSLKLAKLLLLPVFDRHLEY